MTLALGVRRSEGDELVGFNVEDVTESGQDFEGDPFGILGDEAIDLRFREGDPALSERVDQVDFVEGIVDVDIPGLFSDEVADLGSMNDLSAFEDGLSAAIQGFEVDGPLFGSPTYDAVRLSRVESIDVTTVDTQAFFVGGELLIDFEATVLCETTFESVQAIASKGWDELVISRSMWTLTVRGGRTSGSNRTKVVDFDIELINAQLRDYAPGR